VTRRLVAGHAFCRAKTPARLLDRPALRADGLRPLPVGVTGRKQQIGKCQAARHQRLQWHGRPVRGRSARTKAPPSARATHHTPALPSSRGIAVSAVIGPTGQHRATNGAVVAAACSKIPRACDRRRRPPASLPQLPVAMAKAHFVGSSAAALARRPLTSGLSAGCDIFPRPRRAGTSRNGVWWPVVGRKRRRLGNRRCTEV